MEDAFKQRGNAIENAFFREKDKQLLERLRRELHDKEDREALSLASGLKDEEALNALVAIQIQPETLTSVSLIPLIAVAWADGIMEDGERKAVLKAAHEAGVAPGTAAHDLIDSWLDDQLDESILEAWKAYIHAIREQLDPVAFGQLKTSVMGRARDVAKSAGGFLGFNAIKDVEQKLLDELASEF